MKDYCHSNSNCFKKNDKVYIVKGEYEGNIGIIVDKPNDNINFIQLATGDIAKIHDENLKIMPSSEEKEKFGKYENVLIVDWREELFNLFPESTVRIKKDHDKWCPRCGGVGLVKMENYIMNCPECSGSGIEKEHLCKCGNKIDKYYYSICEECRAKAVEQKELQRFEKAEKINFKDYEGMFLWNDQVLDKYELEESINDMLENKEELPTFLYATTKELVFKGIDLKDVIYDYCEDGYEDMYSYMDLKSEKLKQAQDLLNEWVKDQYNNLYMYNEDYSRVVLLDELINKCLEEVVNYPSWYPKLDEDKMHHIIEHCEKYNLEPDICAYYKDWNDFCSDWCDGLGFTENEAKEMLYSNTGEFLIFENWGIIRFTL